jgi:hypothetical protein
VIGLLVRHHPLVNITYFKWLMMAFALATFWLGTMAFLVARTGAAPPWWQLVMIWLPTALFLALGAQGQRCRDFALGLPVSGRTIWVAHVIAVLLTSGVALALCLAVQHGVLILLHGAGELGPERMGPALASQPAVWRDAVVWWLLAVAVLLNDRPHLVEIPRSRREGAIRDAIVLGALIGLALLPPRMGLPGSLVVLAAAVGLFARAWSRVPPALTVAGREPLPAGRSRGRGAVTRRPAPWQRRPRWLVVLMACNKHPQLLLVSSPFVALMGAAISPAITVATDGVQTSVLFVAIAAYMMFSFAAVPLGRLAIFDHLQISRRRLLTYLLVPQLVVLGIGYAGGLAFSRIADPLHEQPLVFNNEGDDYGLRMAGRFFSVAWDDPPAQVAPDGQVIQPPGDWRPLGRSGPTLYKPYHTPRGISLEACAWQLERASARIFDEPIPAHVFRERYLTTAPDDGRVVVRDGALDLRGDFPDRTVRGFPGVDPLVLAMIVVLFCAAYRLHLVQFRPGRSDRQRQVSFVSVLVVLMAIYLLPFGMAVGGIGDPEAVVALSHALGHALTGAVPGGVATLWLTVALLAAIGWAVIWQGFRRAEWPPAREDANLYDVLG